MSDVSGTTDRVASSERRDVRIRPASRAHGPHVDSGPRRVVRILGCLDVGGVEMRLLEMLPGLVAGGIETHVVALAGRPGHLAPRAEATGATVHPLRLDARFPVRFLRLLGQLRPVAVHSHVATFSGAILGLAAAARVPVRIAHFHSEGDGRPDAPRRLAQRALFRTLLRHTATHLVGVAPAALAWNYSADWAADPRCAVLPNGVDLSRMSTDSGVDLRQLVRARPGEILCLHVGRASGVKRRWLIPPVLAALAARGVTAHGVFVGAPDTDDDARVLRAARETGVGHRVHLLGPRSDVGTLLRGADVLLLPSTREGLSGVLLESVAVGTPAVATDLPSTTFVADRASTVVKVPVDASAGVWADGVLAAVREHPVSSRNPEAALAAFGASVFTLSSALARTLELYDGPTVGRGHRLPGTCQGMW